ncbi:hypothetical protein NDU88_009771 [Pleurodeles waltl]|uniref:Uncharacterized protein n=1 Tax=Pleurodeles waltl TaxID=8319 RepID=A0AAV7RW62_PLEWA|nr:hypothetical protein NDU88_009771 [Pleurodeles waltl]
MLLEPVSRGPGEASYPGAPACGTELLQPDKLGERCVRRAQSWVSLPCSRYRCLEPPSTLSPATRKLTGCVLSKLPTKESYLNCLDGLEHHAVRNPELHLRSQPTR